MPRKALLCVLQLDVRSITCPGVLLKDKEELYLSVSVLGQYKKTQCVPAAFPLFFQEKLVFEKAFSDIVDPGDLVELLELDTAVLELIQLVPPGKILATYEENTRDFLFPDPKLTCGQHGLDREILMKRSSSFTGIAPKLRFSTSSLITERLLSSGRSHIQGDLNWVHHSTPNEKLQTKLPKKNTLSPEKTRHSLATKNYEQPTIASKSRSPSPYTKRRMCELSEEARQRLAHLNLGPYEFRRETDKPPFVVRRVEQPSPDIKLHTWCPTQDSTVEAWTKVDHDPSLLGSYRPKKAKAKSTHGKDFDSSDVCHEDVISDPPNRESYTGSGSLKHSAPPAFQKHSLSSVLNRSSLRERFSSGWPSPANGDEIHKRVKNILRTHSARQHLVFAVGEPCKIRPLRPREIVNGRSFNPRKIYPERCPSSGGDTGSHSPLQSQRAQKDESNTSKGDLTKTRESSHKVPLSMSELQSSSPVQQNTTVHLDNGKYWSSRAAIYKGKHHRVIFEESLEKIYRNMYRKASGTVLDQKMHS